MKKLFYILTLGLTLSLAACAPSEVDDIFDESPAVRLDKAIKNYTELLKSNGGRWNMKYFANGDEGGYNFMMLFKNGSVEISGKNAYLELVYGSSFMKVESLWEVVADYGPVLTFNTYNEVFHLFSDPDPDGTGLGGDYEFIIMEASEDRIVLRGKKTGITAVMDRITDNVADEEFFAEVDALQSASFSSLVDTLYVTTSTGYQFATIGHYEEVWTFFPAAGNRADNLIDYPESMNSMCTRNGIRFMEPLNFFTEYDPEAFVPQEFTVQEDGSLLAEDGVTRITAGPLVRWFANGRRNFLINKDDMGGTFKTQYDTFLTETKAADPRHRTITNVGFTYYNIYNAEYFGHFALTFKASNLVCLIFLDYTVVDDNTLRMSFNPNAAIPYNENGRLYYGGKYIDKNGNEKEDAGYQSVRDFVAFLTSTEYSFKTDNVLCPTIMTIYDKANPANYYVVNMSKNSNFVEDQGIEY